MNYLKQWSFPSRSNPSKVYKVSQKEDGSYVCACWPFLRNRNEPCQHIEAVLRGDVETDEVAPQRFIVLAQIEQVTLLDDGVSVLTPLIPPEDTWFQASLIYDLLRAGIPWSEIKERYHLAKRNTKKAIIGYVEQRGRKVKDVISVQFGVPTTYKIIPAKDPLPVHKTIEQETE